MPAYWLGAFFNPRGLLALVKQDYIKHYSGDRSGNFEQFVFQTEVTTRDKEHVSIQFIPASVLSWKIDRTILLIQVSKLHLNAHAGMLTRNLLTCLRKYKPINIDNLVKCVVF